MKSIYKTVKTLLRTEKGTFLEQEGKYLFMVSRQATKPDIKNAIEEIYKVKVKTVNTMLVPSKLKRVRLQFGHTSEWKKAIVTLKPGSKIEVT